MPSNLSEQPDAIRIRIQRRLDEKGMTHAQLSRAIRRDASYINQYFRRGYPIAFDDRTRRDVAEALGVDEAFLLPDHPYQPALVSLPVAERHTRLVESGRLLPTFAEGQPLDPNAIPEWIERPHFVSRAGNSFALHITADHARLKTGDIAFVSGGRPPRSGDLAVVLTMDERQIVAMGTVMEITPDVAKIDVDGTPQAFDRVRFHLLKIVGAQFA